MLRWILRLPTLGLEKCLIACLSQFKEKTATVVMEALIDGEMRMWGYFFNSLEGLNDFNILEQSAIVQKVSNRNNLQDPSYKTNGNKRMMPYYLAD